MSTGIELTNSGKKNTQTAEEGQNSVPLLTTNSSESIQIIGDNISNDLKERRSKHLSWCSLGNNGEATTASGSKQNRKYLDDEKFREKVKATLSNYIGKNCILEQVRIRIRDNEEKGYAVRIKIKDGQEIKVSEFLNGNFCKSKRISRFFLMIDNGQNGLSCDVNAKGTRCYKVQNGPPVVMIINWYVGEKKRTIEIELGISSLKVVNLNEITEEELDANKDVRINGKSLVEAVRDSLQPKNREIIEQISSTIPDIQQLEHSDSQDKKCYVEKVQAEHEKSKETRNIGMVR